MEYHPLRSFAISWAIDAYAGAAYTLIMAIRLFPNYFSEP